jgi:RNA polymerase sigma factor for flagellar operon FliA
MEASTLTRPDEGSEAPELWRQWKDARNPKAREALILHYTPWAQIIARHVFMRVRGRSSDWGDFMQNAVIGLVEAVGSFDPRKGVPFTAFARHRVRGAVFNGMRHLRTCVPYLGASSQLSDRVVSVMNEEGDAVDRFMAVVNGLGIGLALQAGLNTEALVDTVSRSPYKEAEAAQIGHRIRAEFTVLSERERSVIVLHYLQFLPFVQIADIMEITKGRVSQLHKHALEKLRRRLEGSRLAGSL